VLYYTLRCFMMDFWDHSQGECAASSDTELQTKLELASAQVADSLTADTAAWLLSSSDILPKLAEAVQPYGSALLLQAQ
jgi:hypothetical protein